MRGKEVKLIFLAVSLATLMISASFAEDVKTSVDITSVGMGARPIALGGAFTGIADDASAIFTNPAGLGKQKSLSFVSMSTQLLTCVDYKLIGFSYPTQYGNFGIGYAGASTAAGDHTYYDGGVTVEGGAMNYTNQMLILSCGYDASRLVRSNYFGLGANIKFLSQGLSGSIKSAPSASGIEMDLGAIYVPTDRLTFGATLQNIIGSLDWSTGEKEKLPKLLKLGGAYKASNDVTVSLDTDLDLDGVSNTVAHGGVEWQVIPLLALRAGISQKVASVDDETMGTSTDYSLGAGVMLDGFRFDYAYRQDPNFADLSTHYFSISYCGGSNEKSVKGSEPIQRASVPAVKAETPAVKTANIKGASVLEVKAEIPEVKAANIKGASVPAVKAETPAVKTANVKGASVPVVKADIPEVKTANIKGASVLAVKADIPEVKAANINVPAAKIDKIDAKYEKTGITEGNPLSQYERLIREEYKTKGQAK